jgi:hypothetical protein
MLHARSVKFLNMNNELRRIKELAYDKAALLISDLSTEAEGKEYKACQFQLNGLKIICRNAKITPKKNGQFVTFWRRDEDGITEPFHERDEIDFYVINVAKQDRFGQFVIPKSVLIEKGVMSSTKKGGKRGFRVYPNWDTPMNKQAEKTKKWQTKYFIEFCNGVGSEELKVLYEKKNGNAETAVYCPSALGERFGS